MYCRNCGKEIKQESKFCTYCGTKVDYTRNSNLAITQKKSNRKILFAIISTFVVLCIAGTIIGWRLINYSRIVGTWDLNSFVDAESGIEIAPDDKMLGDEDITIRLQIKADHKLELIMTAGKKMEKVKGTWKKEKDGWNFILKDDDMSTSFSAAPKRGTIPKFV